MSSLKDFGIDAVKDVEKKKVAPPPRYNVVLNNDDFTPMDFVVDVLGRFFNMDFEKANQIMVKVHYEGRAVCGMYTAEIAEMKVQQINHYSRENQHPLLCTMEQA
jgi:ATP-dependent Clp protease adaptor protein ClpS